MADSIENLVSSTNPVPLISPSSSFSSTSSASSRRTVQTRSPPPLPPPNPIPPPLPPPNPIAKNPSVATILPSKLANLSIVNVNRTSNNEIDLCHSQQMPIHRSARPHDINHIRLPTARPRTTVFTLPVFRRLSPYWQAISSNCTQFWLELRSDLRNQEFSVRLALLACQYVEALTHLYCWLTSLRLLRWHQSIDASCAVSLSCQNRLMICMCIVLLIDLFAIIAVLCKRPLTLVLTTLLSLVCNFCFWIAFRPSISSGQPLLAITVLVLALWLSMRWIVEQHLDCNQSTEDNLNGVCKHCAHHISTSAI